MAQASHDLEVVAAEEQDIDRLMEVQFSAFENDPIHELLYPGDHFSPAVRKTAGERTLKTCRENPDTHFVKCVQRDTGLILGFAKWEFHLTERPYEEYSKRPVADWTTGRRKEITEIFLNANAAMREKVWGGKPHIGKRCQTRVVTDHVQTLTHGQYWAYCVCIATVNGEGLARLSYNGDWIRRKQLDCLRI